MPRWTLGSTRPPPDIGLPITPMRISSDLRKCVVFLGLDDPDSPGNLHCVGTGFFVGYNGAIYLVTAQHVALTFGDGPFAIRLNRFDGGSDNVTIDPLIDPHRWYCHSDPNVDLAVMPLNKSYRQAGYDVLVCPEEIIAQVRTDHQPTDAFTGDQCYAVGLFRLLHGKTRNLPVVHTGNLALLAGEELIPVHDWLTPSDSRKIRMVDAHLVELQSLQGLSGSPVFVRPPMIITGIQAAGKSHDIMVPLDRIHLLGIWQGAWEAEPDRVAAIQRGKLVRVPVGVGVVTPASKLRELFEMPEVKDEREAWKESLQAAAAAQPDSISVERPQKVVVVPASDNPSHKEDFTSLLSAAAKSNKSAS
jgi:hypothetical protein